MFTKTILVSFILSCIFTFDIYSQDEILTFSHERGFYENTFELTLSTTTIGSQIKYTLDGTNPVTSATAVSGNSPVFIQVDPSNFQGRDRAPGFCVNAVATQSDTAITKVVSHTYLYVNSVVELSPDGQKPGPGWITQNTGRNGKNINYGMDRQITNHALYKDKIVPALLDIPTFSMIMDLKDLFDPQKGIYVNALEHGIDWERSCSIELIYPDGTKGFQINCGVRIRGGWSRNDSNPKHAFRWFFRKEYGETKLRYPLFGDEGVDVFDNMDLRTAQNYSWSYGAEGPEKNTMVRDVFCRDIQRDMGQPYTRSRYYHLYINGTYWGLYQTQERAEANFAADYLGGESEDYDIIKVDGGYQGAFVIEATDGTLDAWQRLWEASMEGFETAEAYYKVQGKNPDGTRNPDYEVLLNVDNLIDFMITVFVSGDGDAPVSSFTGGPNNFYSIYNRNGDQGFIHLRHDAEHTLGTQSFGEDRTGPFSVGQTFEKSNPQWIHQQLCKNPLYVNQFAAHVNQHFFNDGAVTPQVNIRRFLSRKEEIDLAIIAESARWGDSKHEPALTRDRDWIDQIEWIVEDFLPERTDVVLEQLKSQGWYPQVESPAFNAEEGLVQAGFQLQMAAPQGQVYFTTDGSDPLIPENVPDTQLTLVDKNADKSVFVPSYNIGSSWRSDPDFNDSSWKKGNSGVGYDRGTDYNSFIGVDVESEMYNIRSTCYIRIPFSMQLSELDGNNNLRLNMLYDDGFVAYLNGTEIARAKAPAYTSWSSGASDNHEALQWQSFQISEFVDILQEGENLLAIHGLNRSINSSDFLISTELIACPGLNSGVLSDVAITYAEPLSIVNTTQVKARALHNENWSALAAIKLYVLDGFDPLKITEIHYHPLDEGDIDDNDNNYEFIEFKNIGSGTLDISGFYFSDGIQYTFPDNTQIQSDQFIVLAADINSFEQRYDFIPFGEYSGQLANGGERISLNTILNDTLISLDFGDDYPWPRSADGEGFSMISSKATPYENPDDPKYWVTSGEIHGSPGENDLYVPVIIDENQISQNISLHYNYPNPFNSVTDIVYQLSQRSYVNLKIYNVLGQQVSTLVDAYQNAGRHRASFDAAYLATGIYFYRLSIGDDIKLGKMLFNK